MEPLWIHSGTTASHADLFRSNLTSEAPVNRSVFVVAAFVIAIAAPAFAQTRTYKVLATNKTSTMQKEMQEAGQLGFRFVAVMGGATAGGGKEVVVLMEKDPANQTFDYRLLAATRTSTLQKEMQEAGDSGFGVVGQTVFESMFGGAETAAIVERGSAGSKVRYEYRLVATARTSTLERELQEAAADGFIAVDLTVGKTALGGNEVVVITRRAKQSP